MIARRSLAIVIVSMLAIAVLAPAVLADGVDDAEDSFDSGTYSGGSGWATSWLETGDGGSPSGGSIQVVGSGSCDGGSCVQFGAILSLAVGLYRTADFEGADSLTLSFRYRKSGLGALSVRAGQNPSSLVAVGSPLGNTSTMTSVSLDISPHAAEGTTVMFYSTLGLLASAYVDNVRIEATYPATTTTSTTTSSTSITPTSVTTIPVVTTSVPVIVPTTSTTSTTSTTIPGTTTVAPSTSTTTVISGSGGDDPEDSGNDGSPTEGPDPSQPTEAEMVAAAENNVTVGLVSGEDFDGFAPSSIGPLTDLGVRLSSDVESISTDILSALGLGAFIAIVGVRRIDDEDGEDPS